MSAHSDTATESADRTTADSKAINIQSILNAFMKYVLKMLKGKTDNELWLEKINMIPETEFQIIGSGGYGQVYKIKVKTESKELAVKIVKGCRKIERLWTSNTRVRKGISNCFEPR